MKDEIKEWHIARNIERYGEMFLYTRESDLPEKVLCVGTRKQADALAESMSTWSTPGCDFGYYVVDSPDKKGASF